MPIGVKVNGGHMDQLIADIAAKTGVDQSAARQAVAIILGFLSREGPPDKIDALIDGLPGARELAAEAPAGGSGIMGVFNDLSGAGLGLGDIQKATREFATFAKTKVGDAAVNDVVRAIPGLSQFV
jgi:hypothetical protein